MKLTRNLSCTVLIGLFCFVSSLFAQGLEFPRAQGFINDFANLITPEDFQKLNALAIALEQKTTAEIAVVTLKTRKY